MTILYKHTNDGGFLAGDTETGRATYAYPGSKSADYAKRSPASMALDMLARDSFRPSGAIGREVAARDAKWLADLALTGTAA